MHFEQILDIAVFWESNRNVIGIDCILEEHYNGNEDDSQNTTKMMMEKM